MTEEQILASQHCGDHGCSENQQYECSAIDESVGSESEDCDFAEPDLEQGTGVEVVGFGVAKIISLGRMPHGKHQGKYKVRYIDDGSMYHIWPEQIAQVLPPEAASMPCSRLVG